MLTYYDDHTVTTDADGSESTNTYDHSGNRIAAIDALGSEAAAAYDGRGRISTLTDALGNTTSYTYDLNGNLTSETLANGAETRYTYNACGRIVSITADGETVRYTYDAAGNVTSVTTADGNITCYTYDCMSRVLSEKAPDGTVTNYTYNLAGNLTSKTDSKGNETHYEYDLLGNLLTESDSQGIVISYVYDALNRVVSFTDAEGTVTRYEYDATGNSISAISEGETPASEPVPTKSPAATLYPGEMRSVSAYEIVTLSAHANTKYKIMPLASPKGTLFGEIKNGLKSIGNTLKSWGESISQTASKAVNAVKNAFNGGGNSQPKNTPAHKTTPTPTPAPALRDKSVRNNGGGCKPAPVTQTPVNSAWSPTAAQTAYTAQPSVSGWNNSSCSRMQTENSGLTFWEALLYSVRNPSPALVATSGGIAFADTPAPGPADIIAGFVLVGGTLIYAYDLHKSGTGALPFITLEPKEPTIFVDPLPDLRLPSIESFPKGENKKGLDILPEPIPQEAPGLHTTAPMVPEENTGNILTADEYGLPDQAGRGQSKGGRHEPANLEEKLAMEEAMTNPEAGVVLEGKNTDPRWPEKEGWKKYAQNVNGYEIHYMYNPTTGEIDDVKLKN